MSLPEPIEMVFFHGAEPDGADAFCVRPKSDLTGRPSHKVLVTFLEEFPPCTHENVQPMGVGGTFLCRGCSIEMVPTSFIPKKKPKDGNGSK